MIIPKPLLANIHSHQLLVAMRGYLEAIKAFIAVGLILRFYLTMHSLSKSVKECPVITFNIYKSSL